MNTTCPDEERLKSLICEAFDELAGADSTRLGQIGTKLGKQAHGNKSRKRSRHHWLVWLLLGAATTATAWWAVKELAYRQDQTQPGISEPASEHQQPALDVTAPATNGQKQNSSTNKQPDNNVIYQRELY